MKIKFDDTVNLSLKGILGKYAIETIVSKLGEKVIELLLQAAQNHLFKVYEGNLGGNYQDDYYQILVALIVAIDKSLVIPEEERENARNIETVYDVNNQILTETNNYKCVKYSESTYVFYNFTREIVINDARNTLRSTIKVIVIGKDYKKIDKYINRFLEYNNIDVHLPKKGEVSTTTINIITETGSTQTSQNNRDWSTVFIPTEQKRRIEYQLDEFINSQEYYLKMGWIYKMNIILTGIPGTGKTSIGRVISTMYSRNKRDIPKHLRIGMKSISYIVQASNLYQSYKELYKMPGFKNTSCIRVLIIEEIDEVMKPENDKSREILMQILDGPLSMNGLITVCTTNYEDKLDHRIFERFNVQENVDGMAAEHAIQLCRQYEVNPEEILLDEKLIEYDPHVEENRYVPRRVENKIKLYKSKSFSSNSCLSIDLDSEN